LKLARNSYVTGNSKLPFANAYNNYGATPMLHSNEIL
jgi:hypothetical protein